MICSLEARYHKNSLDWELARIVTERADGTYDIDFVGEGEPHETERKVKHPVSVEGVDLLRPLPEEDPNAAAGGDGSGGFGASFYGGGGDGGFGSESARRAALIEGARVKAYHKRSTRWLVGTVVFAHDDGSGTYDVMFDDRADAPWNIEYRRKMGFATASDNVSAVVGASGRALTGFTVNGTTQLSVNRRLVTSCSTRTNLPQGAS